MADAYFTLTPAIIERFWRFVAVCEHGRTCKGCCWLWQGAKDRDAYGIFYLTYRSKTVAQSKTGAHRFMWEHCHGPIPLGLYACHHCDQPPCVNVHHLYVGSNSDNQRDAIRKGRRLPGGPPSKGEQNPRAKFHNDDIRAVREAWQGGATMKGLARLYRVAPATIRRIVTYRRWSHLP